MKTKNLSSFAQSALSLEHEFTELDRIGGMIERLDIETDNGLQQAVKLLPQFVQHAKNITDGVQVFASAIDAARRRSDMAATAVAEKALLVQTRKEAQDKLYEKFRELASRVRGVSEGLSKIDGTSKASSKLREVEETLNTFVEEAKIIRQEAQDSRMKSLEKSAESLFGSLQSARKKVNALATTIH